MCRKYLEANNYVTILHFNVAQIHYMLHFNYPVRTEVQKEACAMEFL